MSSSPARLKYLPQLDSFRFFAVFLVIIYHWFPNNRINLIPNGYLGVTFFFVLSGFLISSNLLYQKRELDKGLISFGKAIKTFYIRRTLRIFPLYFLVIFLVFALVPLAFEGHFLWYVTYAPNFLFFRIHEWPGMLSHFWSLGVEEQFYLIWPFLILIIPLKFLKYLFPAIIGLSIIFKFIFFKYSGSFFSFYDVLPISCFDAFGIGALLALHILEANKFSHFLSRIPVGLGILGAVIMACFIYFFGISYLFGLAVSIASFYFILGAIRGYKGLLAVIINNQVIRYLGKISYGLYVYHNFIPWLLRCIKGEETAYPLSIHIINPACIQSPITSFFIQCLLLVAIASLSWTFIERPINNLKKYFV
ncbi:MAG TPA: acyltransferase [Aquella sp.]|nr:acyltransferase [Aquella sp.]